MATQLLRFISAAMALITALLNLLGAYIVPDGWQLRGIPAYRGGVYSEDSYNCGSGLESDLNGATESDSFMQLISETNLSEVNAYCETLASCGYVEVFSNRIDKNYSYAFRNDDGRQIYLTYCGVNNEVRIIDDTCADGIEDFGYTYTDAEECAEMYQYSFPYFDPEFCSDETKYSKNGMLYVIRLADNKLMVIDGGSVLQTTEYNVDRFMAFLHDITHTQSGEKVDIAMWFGTHGHGDHILFFGKLLSMHHDELSVERIMFNYPSKSVLSYGAAVDGFRRQLRELYPDAKYIKPHSGFEFPLADINIQVLYTHENGVDAVTGKFDSEVFNDSSTVLRIDIGGKKFMILGDSDKLVQRELLEMYQNKTLKCDVVQAAHHLYNPLKKLYAVLLPEYAFCSQSKHKAVIKMKAYRVLLQYIPENNLLFADEGIYGMTVKDGDLIVSFREGECKPYDGLT